MSTAPSAIAIDRAYDLRVLAAIPSTLGLFAPCTLEAQLREMASRRRAICFTLMSPVASLRESDNANAPEIATVLVCLHVAPQLAACGLGTLLRILARTAETASEPVHEIFTKLARDERAPVAGFYREAVYAEADAAIALTTHMPVELPPELMDAVAPATQGMPVDIVTTVAVSRWRPELATVSSVRGAVPRSMIH